MSRRIVVGLAAAALAAVGTAVLLKGRRQALPLSEPIQRASLTEAVYGIGTVTAARSFQLKSGVTSTLRRLYVREGDVVRKGQRLAEIEGNIFTAPFDGTITLLPHKEGETIFSQAIVASLVDLADRYLVVSLEQRAIMRVIRGQKAKLSFESFREETYEGEVEAIYSSDGNFIVRIGVKRLAPQILPGMTADVAIAVDRRDNVLVVPIAAIEHGRVLVKRGRGRPFGVSVKTGLVDQAMAEIVDGDLKEGDRLVLRKKKAP